MSPGIANGNSCAAYWICAISRQSSPRLRKTKPAMTISPPCTWQVSPGTWPTSCGDPSLPTSPARSRPAPRNSNANLKRGRTHEHDQQTTQSLVDLPRHRGGVLCRPLHHSLRHADAVLPAAGHPGGAATRSGKGASRSVPPCFIHSRCPRHAQHSSERLCPAGASASPANLSGIWRGKTAIAGRGICALRFELSEKELGHFAGYSSLACANFAPLMSPQDRGNIAAAVLNKLNPADAILSGAMENGSIRFHVDKTIGTNSNGCAATSFTVTPFGSNQLAAEWQEGGCQGDHVILQKARS